MAGARKALVTGAGGFIGSHLVEALLADGWEVVATVRYTSTGAIGYLADLAPGQRPEIRLGNLCDEEFVRDCAKGVDTIFHLGAHISIPHSYVSPRDVVVNNVVTTVNALEAARSQGVRRLVHTSTSEVFGTAQTPSIDEGHPLHAQSPYAASKIAADKVVESYNRAFGLETITVRPFNTYGPRQSRRAVIAHLIHQALAGGTVRLGSLTPRRDFTFVTDTARAFVAAADAPEAAIGRHVNLGTGTDVAIADIVTMVGEILGRPLDVVEEAARIRPSASEVMRLTADNRLARELLGWQPRISLQQGLARTIDWVAANRSRLDGQDQAR
ncbi:MAG: GDP-mannose 4,6-dehydratase [Azospirillaceae bacterium]